jgi:DNA helicase II / ATP-dependent DNA helicase PcrA
MTPSLYQTAIYDWIEHGMGNALVDAVACAGKTTVLIESAKRIKTTNVCFVVFNKVIA